MSEQILHFSVSGEFVTNLAREKFYVDHQLGKAIEIVASATVSDQLSEAEHLLLCIEIIAGRKNIVGTYPGDDYGIETTDDTPFSAIDFIKEFDTIKNELDDTKEELQKTYNKLSTILGEMDEWELKRIARRYYDETGEHLFPDESRIVDNKFIEFLAEKDSDEVANSAVDSFIARITDNNTYTYEDYGWLEPDGTYHEVEWGEHSSWAREYCETHYPFKTHANMYWKEDANGDKKHYVNGDFLVYVLGWVLLDSPYQGLATPKYDVIKGMTKSQKEFLYDYYIERNRNKEANELWGDE